MEKQITVARSELAEAFKRWREEAKANPDEFTSWADDGNEFDSADALIGFVEKVQAGK